MEIWRIEQFKVKKSQTPAGTFYSDDSYIILNTFKAPEGDKLLHDVHFWLGRTTSQDEAGTAAYKTVELDDYLGGDPIQHREVDGHESHLFLSYFKDIGGVCLLEGGVASGFNKVKPEEFTPRLLLIKGRKFVRVQEVPLEIASLNAGDVFVLDAGLKIYQWQGRKSSKEEKHRAGALSRSLDDQRSGKPDVEVLEQGEKGNEDFWKHFGLTEEPSDIKDEDANDDAWEMDNSKKCFHLSDESGKLTFELKGEGTLSEDMLDEKDVFIIDAGHEIFCWIGKEASENERKQAMYRATKYIKDNGRPNYLPVTVVDSN